MSMLRVLSSPATVGGAEQRHGSLAFRSTPLQRRLPGQVSFEQTQSPLKPTKIWRSTGGTTTQTSPLPPLAKGASRHRVPSWAAETRVVARTPGKRPDPGPSSDPDLAESFGRKMLGDDPWHRKVFQAVTQSCSSEYLVPADWAALTSRLRAELGTASGQFLYRFAMADTNIDGRVDMEEWEAFAMTMELVFGHRRCRIASMRYLGTRKAEARSRVKNIYMFDGYDQDASLRLLMACSKWNSPSLMDSVYSALDAKADPNAGLADSRFNDYTPLIFLAMAQPTADGTQVAMAIDTLVKARADVHRESGPMPFGRLVPLRFAARLQNRRGLEALLRHVDVGDRFSWAAGENVEHVMLDELRQLYGDSTCQRIAARSRYGTQATVLLKLFASPIVGGKLTPDGAQKLLEGQFADGHFKLGSKADPDGPGLEGMTALMYVVKKGDYETTVALLKGKATPLQQDSSGATPLHFAAAGVFPEIARALLDYQAEPSMVDHAGFSAWMVAGEAFVGASHHGPLGDDGAKHRVHAADLVDFDPGDYTELMELLKPRYAPDALLDQAENDGLQGLIDELGTDPEVLAKHLRLHESLFFDPRFAVRGAYEGRFPRKPLLMRVKDLLLDMLRYDPLRGKPKAVAKYLLFATMGPTGEVACGHVRHKWSTKDNRCAYRRELNEAVEEMLNKFAGECNGFRHSIERKADVEKLGDFHRTLDSDYSPARTPPTVSGELTSTSPLNTRILERAPSFAVGGSACLALCSLPANEIDVPRSWQEEDDYWRSVQERQILRYDPPWARSVSSGASCSLQLLRLGAVEDLSDCSALQQVHHASMEEQLARGYMAYAELCNVPFQDRVKEVAARVALREDLDVQPPPHVVPTKRLKRLMEKTREARQDHGDLQWPGLTQSYLRFGHCFHILDAVRTAFTCGGNSLGEQVMCAMELVKEFEACTAQRDGLRVLRRKCSFAAGGERASGGYADIKLLVYADLGTHRAFDEVEVPLRIVGEVQIILKKYMDVKLRMHLVYEVSRGSFDRKSSLAEKGRESSQNPARRALRKLTVG